MTKSFPQQWHPMTCCLMVEEQIHGFCAIRGEETLSRTVSPERSNPTRKGRFFLNKNGSIASTRQVLKKNEASTLGRHARTVFYKTHEFHSITHVSLGHKDHSARGTKAFKQCDLKYFPISAMDFPVKDHYCFLPNNNDLINTEHCSTKLGFSISPFRRLFLFPPEDGFLN